MRRAAIILFVGLGTLGAVAVGGAVVWVATTPSYAALRRDGGRMIAVIEQYREEHGRYPESLAAAGIEPPRSRYGPWEYEAGEDGAYFALSIGDYGRDGFVYVYNSHRGTWYADT